MKVSPERMRYKDDKRSANYVFCAIGFNILYFIAVYSNNSIVPNISIGIDVIVNILFMLTAFWASEMVKVYDRKWSFGLVVMAIIQFLRILWIPSEFHQAGQLVGSSYRFVWVALTISGVFLLLGAVRSYRNATVLINYMKQLASSGKEES